MVCHFSSLVRRTSVSVSPKVTGREFTLTFCSYDFLLPQDGSSKTLFLGLSFILRSRSVYSSHTHILFL